MIMKLIIIVFCVKIIIICDAYTIDKYYWRNRHNITYSLFTNTVPKYLNVTQIKNETHNALSVWHAAKTYDTNENILRFVYTHDNDVHANIKIKFAVYDHDDSFNFDGRDGILAHAFPPPLIFFNDTDATKITSPVSGEVHFDGDELWLTQNDANPSPNGTSFMYTLVHEIGHALGLFHSSQEESIMYPFYKFQMVNKTISLQKDDINGLDQLYIGQRHQHQTTTSTSVIVEEELPSWLYDVTTNYIDESCNGPPKKLSIIRDEYYVFANDIFWRYSDYNLTQLMGKYKLDKSWWSEMCRVDCATTRQDKIILVNNRLWFVYNTTVLDTVHVMSHYFNTLFEENDLLYGVHNHTDLYIIDEHYNIMHIGRVHDKFHNIFKIDWVVFVNDHEAHVGIGNGRLITQKMYTNATIGHVFKIVDNDYNDVVNVGAAIKPWHQCGLF
ncbi:mp-nase [Cnaphalocrocis medinalis granulovirus]|uniref:Mp-nase n=1 Tax=Cnaphalocrocis medinalis granulovirus TaxID=1750712 RepID=A0A109WW48_9BBAC|nr:mp-nase [Cnaphalocrocis medinalis granulovirus]AMF83791.1 mp-nase [Cnaphalocrocis medinalis granulovirus]